MLELVRVPALVLVLVLVLDNAGRMPLSRSNQRQQSANEDQQAAFSALAGSLDGASTMPNVIEAVPGRFLRRVSIKTCAALHRYSCERSPEGSRVTKRVGGWV